MCLYDIKTHLNSLLVWFENLSINLSTRNDDLPIWIDAVRYRTMFEYFLRKYTFGHMGWDSPHPLPLKKDPFPRRSLFLLIEYFQVYHINLVLFSIFSL